MLDASVDQKKERARRRHEEMLKKMQVCAGLMLCPGLYGVGGSLLHCTTAVDARVSNPRAFRIAAAADDSFLCPPPCHRGCHLFEACLPQYYQSYQSPLLLSFLSLLRFSSVIF